MKHPVTSSIIAVLALALCVAPVFAEEKADVAEALYGEWKIVEMVFHTVPQEFGGRRGGWIKFEKGKISFADSDHRYGSKFPCTVGGGKIEWDQDLGFRDGPTIVYGLYELKNGRLRIITSETFGERPKGFDAAYTSRDATLWVLRQVVK